MKLFHPLSNDVCGLTAQTVGAFAHRFRVVSCGFRQWKTATVPPEGGVGNPPAFSTGRSDPDPRFAPSVDDRKSPLGFEINHVGVGNQLGLEGVYDLNRIAPENKFWSHPYDVGDGSETATEYEFDSRLQRVGNDIQAVYGEEKNKHVRHTCEDKVSPRAKSFIHTPSIAGRR